MSMWTEERVGDLKRLWGEGHSCSIIAGMLGGATRNAVIGKVHRLNLPKRKTLVSQDRTRPVDRRGPRRRQRITPRLAIKRSGNGSHTYVHRRKEQEAPVTPVRVALPEPVSLDLTLMALKAGQCRWGHGDGPFLFCGHPGKDGSRYCPHHHARTVRPDPLSRSKRRSAENHFAAVDARGFGASSSELSEGVFQ